MVGGLDDMAFGEDDDGEVCDVVCKVDVVGMDGWMVEASKINGRRI